MVKLPRDYFQLINMRFTCWGCPGSMPSGLRACCAPDTPAEGCWINREKMEGGSSKLTGSGILTGSGVLTGSTCSVLTGIQSNAGHSDQ